MRRSHVCRAFRVIFLYSKINIQMDFSNATAIDLLCSSSTKRFLSERKHVIEKNSTFNSYCCYEQQLFVNHIFLV